MVQWLLQDWHQGESTKVNESYIKGPVKNTIVKHSGSIQEYFLSMIERSSDVPESRKVLLEWEIGLSRTIFEAVVVRDEFSNQGVTEMTWD